MKTILTAALAASIAVAVAAAPAAGATPAHDEALFLSLVTSEGLTFESADMAIVEGRAVCGVLDDGMSVGAAVLAVDEVLPVDYDGAVTVTAAAIIAFCPWNTPGKTLA